MTLNTEDRGGRNAGEVSDSEEMLAGSSERVGVANELACVTAGSGAGEQPRMGGIRE